MMEQIAIALTGATAVWLSQDQRAAWRRWACIFGLCGQPFWFYSAYVAQQWGIFALCVLYTYSWVRGFKNHWMRSNAELRGASQLAGEASRSNDGLGKEE